MATVVLLGTLDTKGHEYAYVREQLAAHGVEVLVVDAGVHEPVGLAPDISRFEVARAAGADIDSLVREGDRGRATAMGQGAAAVVLSLHARGRLDGILALGGGGGSSIAARAMQALPVGAPELGGRPLLAASVFGVTTPCVTAARQWPEVRGFEVLVFHQTGGRPCSSSSSAPRSARTATSSSTSPTSSPGLPSSARPRGAADECGRRRGRFRCPARRHPGHVANVALGFGDLAGYTSPRYLANCLYFGSTIGRFANRIAGGRFTLDGTEHELPVNNGPHTLHGGISGFDQRVWSAGQAGGGVRMRYTSADGEQGFPGTLQAAVTISLDDRGCLRMDCQATADRPTIVNLTNHSYWNLAGEGSGPVHGHRLLINADRYTPVVAGLIPTGPLDGVAGTPFDFRVSRAIGDRVGDHHQQLVLAGGYDHNYVLNRAAGGPGRQLAAIAADPASGRQVTVETTEPGLQFYSGNFLDGSFTGPSGRPYHEGDGFALETQHFPDSPNQPGFPSTVLRPGTVYRSSTSYTFSAAGRV